MSAFRDIRVLPVVLAAVLGLAVLKFAGLAIDGGYVFDYNPQSTQKSWAQEYLNFPAGDRRTADAGDDGDVTGSVGAGAKAAPAVKPPETAPPAGAIVIPEQPKVASESERAILERLQSRRQELDARAREIDIRENLLKAAEARIADRVKELKETEARIDTRTQARNDADAARFKGLVTTYEAMKPKDAAKVFDRLEMSVLYEIASQIAPRKMSDILGQMTPEAAERLTVELARRAGGDKTVAATELPKIEGTPTVPDR
ncbi:MAG: flagellar protein FlbB [Xanthobacteraceae bacterium]|nr:flagellar protein FlbB [Xanthobacteraceae bacterium]